MVTKLVIHLPSINFRKMIFIAVLGAVSLGGVSLVSPYWTINQIREACKEGDAEKVSNYIDFESLRSSFKAQMRILILSSLMEEQKDNPYAALGLVMVNQMIDPMIEAIVTPEGMTAMLRGQTPEKIAAGAGMGEKDGQHASPDSVGAEPEVRQSYKSWSVFEVKLTRPNNPNDNGMTFILHRQGLFSWKIVRVTLQEFKEHDEKKSASEKEKSPMQNEGVSTTKVVGATPMKEMEGSRGDFTSVETFIEGLEKSHE